MISLIEEYEPTDDDDRDAIEHQPAGRLSEAEAVAQAFGWRPEPEKLPDAAA